MKQQSITYSYPVAQTVFGGFAASLDTTFCMLHSRHAWDAQARALGVYSVLMPLSATLSTVMTLINLWELMTLRQRTELDAESQEKKSDLTKQIAFQIPYVALGWVTVGMKLSGTAALMAAAGYVFLAATSLAVIYNGYELIYHIVRSLQPGISTDQKAHHRQAAVANAVTIALMGIVIAYTILLMSNPLGIGCTLAAAAASMFGAVILWQALKWCNLTPYIKRGCFAKSYYPSLMQAKNQPNVPTNLPGKSNCDTEEKTAIINIDFNYMKVI